jgi:hypothetical protein
VPRLEPEVREERTQRVLQRELPAQQRLGLQQACQAEAQEQRVQPGPELQKQVRLQPELLRQASL